MLVGERSYRIKQIISSEKFAFENIYTFEEIKRSINDLGNFKVELISDECNIELKGDSNSTRTVDGIQVLGNIIYPWKILKITRYKNN